MEERRVQLSFGRSRCPAALIAALLAFAADSASASNPEQVQDLGPKKGQSSLQYVGQVASTDGSDQGREHSPQFLHGLSDRLAVGSEVQRSYHSGPQIEDDGFKFDYGSLVALVRFSDAEEDPVGAGLWLQAGLDTDGETAILESRFILEKKTESLWAQGNAMLRRVNDEEEEGSYFAYSARLSGSVAKDLWLGIESSGQPARISGFHEEPFDGAIYLGPSLFYEGQFGGSEARIGASYLRRIDEDQPLRNVFQLSAEVSF